MAQRIVVVALVASMHVQGRAALAIHEHCGFLIGLPWFGACASVQAGRCRHPFCARPVYGRPTEES